MTFKDLTKGKMYKYPNSESLFVYEGMHNRHFAKFTAGYYDKILCGFVADEIVYFNDFDLTELTPLDDKQLEDVSRLM